MFEYILSLGRQLYDSRKNIKRIFFFISRYGEVEEIIEFPQPVSEFEAVKAVEAYLSQPLDDAHYEKVKDDLFVGVDSKEKAFKWYQTRGDCLGDCHFLESVRTDSQGNCLLRCGS